MKTIHNLTTQEIFWCYDTKRLSESEFEARLFFQNPEVGQIIELSPNIFKTNDQQNQTTLFEITKIDFVRDHVGDFTNQDLKKNSYCEVQLRQLSKEEVKTLREEIKLQQEQTA